VSADYGQYASNMDEIHALGAAVSMAADGGRSVKGGNWQIFQKMLDESEASQKLGVEVCLSPL
jgi:prenylcysteine oxidase/farnesylcysteine lyase